MSEMVSKTWIFRKKITHELQNCERDVLFGSLEAVFGKPPKVLLTKSYQQNVMSTVVDEALTIVQW